MDQPTTIETVAHQLGCEVSTVSRALNGTGPTSTETRERVLEAAEALGFEFSTLEQSQASRQARTIGCVVPSLVDPAFADAVREVQAQARARGYRLLLMCSEYSAELEYDAVRMLVANNVEGLVLTLSTAESNPCIPYARDHGVPTCLMFNSPPRGSASFCVDNYDAAALVAGHLVRAGHTKAGFLALRFETSDRSRQRFEGFRDGWAVHGLGAPALLEVDEEPEDLQEILHAFLTACPDVTVLFASNDYLALDAIRAARALGRDVPGDISVVGFDGIAIGRMVEPSLATVETDSRCMGRSAICALLDAIDEQRDPLPPEEPQPFRFRLGGTLGPARPDNATTVR